MKRILSLLLMLSILLGCFFTVGFSVRAAEKELTLTAENVGDSDFNADSETDRQKLIDLEKDLPSTIDLRNYHGKNYVTPVKLQNPYGSCWAFAMAAAAEISYLYENDMGVPAGEVNDQVDFSEKYISWYMHHALTEEDVQSGAIPASQVGEGFDLSQCEQNDRNFAYNIAGNPLFGVNFYASGFGPVDESTSVNGEYPYFYAGKNRLRGTDPDEVSEELATRRKQRAYTDYKSAVNALIENGMLQSPDEFDNWFENNWKSGYMIYAKYLTEIGYSADDDWTLPLNAQYRLPEIQAYFKSCFLLPSPCSQDEDDFYQFDRAGVAAIKSEISKGHGVSIGIQAAQSMPGETPSEDDHMNTTTWAQYYADDTKMNHLVTIVGYDDNYAKENFTRTKYGAVDERSTPPGNGAFIVKNSWGSLSQEDLDTATENPFGKPVYKNPNAGKWGIDDTGYFYLSYYDHSIRTPISFSFYNEDETLFYEMNYDQYDLMQDVQYNDLDLHSDRAGAANIFCAEEDGYLNQISVMVSNPMTDICYEVYKDVQDTPDSGELVDSGKISKLFAGYQRIDLSELIYLPKGTRYSVVVTQEVHDENDHVHTPVCISLCVNRSGNSGSHIHTVINRGESFVKSDNKWQDLTELKSQTEKVYFDTAASEFSPIDFLKMFPNQQEDFQIDNLPIKAFIVPARTVTEFTIGDADLDQEVTITDATTIQRYDIEMIQLSRTAKAAADVDDDQDVTIIDATWIQRWDLEMNAPEKIGKPFVMRKEETDPQ